MIPNTREDFWSNTYDFPKQSDAIIECYSVGGASMHKLSHRDSVYHKCSARSLGDVVILITTDKYVDPAIFRPALGANAVVAINHQYAPRNRNLSLFASEDFDTALCANIFATAKEAALEANGAKITEDGEFYTAIIYHSSEMVIGRDTFSRFCNVRVMNQDKYLMESPISIDFRFHSQSLSNKSLMQDVDLASPNFRHPCVFDFSWHKSPHIGTPYERRLEFVKIVHRCLQNTLGEIVVQDLGRAISILPMMGKVKLSQVALGGLDNSNMGMLGDFRKSHKSILAFKPSPHSRTFLEDVHINGVERQGGPLIYISKAASMDSAHLHVSTRTTQSRRRENFSKIFLKHLVEQDVAIDRITCGLHRTYYDHPVICRATPARLDYNSIKRDGSLRVKVHNCRAPLGGGSYNLSYATSEYVSLAHYCNMVINKLGRLVDGWQKSPVAIR